jgi:hypothetical protein
MPNQSKSVSRRLVFAAVAFACVSFGLTGASADVLPVTYTINGISGTNGWYRGNQYGNFVVVNWSINVPVIDSTQLRTDAGPRSKHRRYSNVPSTAERRNLGRHHDAPDQDRR